MLLSLLKGNVIYDCLLPEKIKGKYWVTQTDEQGYEENVISVEGYEEKWVLKSNKNAVILDANNNRIKETTIEKLEVYPIYLKKTDETVLLYAEPITEDRNKYTKLILPLEGRLMIGRSEDCDIRYANKYVSSNHAELIINENSIEIHNKSKSNGTYVNGSKIIEKMLVP